MICNNEKGLNRQIVKRQDTSTITCNNMTALSNLWNNKKSKALKEMDHTSLNPSNLPETFAGDLQLAEETYFMSEREQIYSASSAKASTSSH